MAEIIGVVAAAEQFAEVIFKTVKLVKSVADQIQDGPGQIQQNIQRLESLASLAKEIQNTKSLQTEDIGKILTRCECHVQSLEDLLQNISFNHHDSIQKKVWRAFSGLKREPNISQLFTDLNNEYNSLNTHISLRILEKAGETDSLSPDSLKCQQALFITDPAIDRAKLINSKGELVRGTCDWITQKNQFVEWRASNGGLLWISGGPGLGKTMLSIYLTEYLSSCFSSAEDGKTHYSTYFFCDAKDNTRNNAIAIVRGILFQVVKQKKELINHILPSYQVQKDKLFQSSFETVWEFFVDMINDLGESQVTCILDGLDECEPKSLELLLKSLKKINKRISRLKMIVLSREYPQCLGVSLDQFPRIRLDPDAKTEVNQGLEQYISARVAELSETKQYTTQLANHVKQSLIEKSAGTYLWVSFTVKDLQAMEISEVEKRLNQFPQGLDGLYERILQQIESTRRGITLDILRWCAFAVRPLSFDELFIVLGIDSTEMLDRTRILREKLEYCDHFLNITDNTATLIHHSAYDFLTRQIPNSEAMPWFSLSNVELEQSKLASACISHFCSVYAKDPFVFEAETVEHDERRKLCYPFFDYASRQWTEHFKNSGQQGVKILDEYPEFFSDESELLKSWMKLANTIRYADTTKTPHRAKESYYDKPLNGQAELAANYGLPVLMKRVLKKEGSWRYLKDLFTKSSGSTDSTHLQIAAAKGHVPILKMLLKHKVRIDSQNSLGHTGLYCAAENGHLHAVKMLLENGAHIDCEMTDGGTALQVSVARGHYKIVQYLLAHGANVNDGPNATALNSPLRAAVSTNRPEMVKLLLERGAGDRPGDGFQPYFIRMLNVFIEYWAERFCATPSQFRDKIEFGDTTVPCLHTACRSGDLRSIRTLLDPKWSLDVNRQDKNGNTALHFAAWAGELQAMRLLLVNPSVNPKLLNLWGLSPFHLALFRLQLNVVEYLYMIRNWNILPPESNGKCGWDAIHLILLGDRCGDRPIEDMLRLLVIELGVDPETRTPKAKNPDHRWHNHHFSNQDGILPPYAGLKGSIEPKDFCHETPLSLAIYRGCFGAVDYLLADCNVDPNKPCRGCDGASPLHVAAQCLRDDIVGSLTSKWKANVNCLDNRQRTPLHAVTSAKAVFYKRLPNGDNQIGSRNRIIQILIAAGAQTSATDINGCTPRDLLVSNKSYEGCGGHMDRGDEFDSIIRSCNEFKIHLMEYGDEKKG